MGRHELGAARMTVEQPKASVNTCQIDELAEVPRLFWYFKPVFCRFGQSPLTRSVMERGLTGGQDSRGALLKLLEVDVSLLRNGSPCVSQDCQRIYDACTTEKGDASLQFIQVQVRVQVQQRVISLLEQLTPFSVTRSTEL